MHGFNEGHIAPFMFNEIRTFSHITHEYFDLISPNFTHSRKLGQYGKFLLFNAEGSVTWSPGQKVDQLLQDRR